MGLLICVLIYRQVGRNLIIPGGTRIIDARGKYVIPGNLQNFMYLYQMLMCCHSAQLYCLAAMLSILYGYRTHNYAES